MSYSILSLSTHWTSSCYTCFPWDECFTEISYSCCLHCRNLRCNPNMSQNACDVNIPIPCYLNWQNLKPVLIQRSRRHEWNPGHRSPVIVRPAHFTDCRPSYSPWIKSQTLLMHQSSNLHMYALCQKRKKKLKGKLHSFSISFKRTGGLTWWVNCRQSYWSWLPKCLQRNLWQWDDEPG